MKFGRFVFFAIFCARLATSQTVIMGHHIGESVSEFLAAEPGLASRIESCRASEPRPMTPEQIHALSKHDVEALGTQVFATVLNSTDTKFRVNLKRVPHRGELEDLAKQGMPITIDKRMPDVIKTCHSLLALTAPGASMPVLIKSLPDSRPQPVIWRFEHGTLFQIDIDFHGVDFLQIVNDFSSKTGVTPNASKEVDTPNLYGATLRISRKATWLTPELYVLFEDEEGLTAGQMHASIISRAAYDDWAKAHAAKNTLD